MRLLQISSSALRAPFFCLYMKDYLSDRVKLFLIMQKHVLISPPTTQIKSNKMKPKELLEMTTIPTDSLHTEIRGKTIFRKLAYMVIGFVTFAIMVDALLLSVYLGIKITQDNCNATIQIQCPDKNCYKLQSTFEENHMARKYFDVTDIWLNNEALGPRSSEFCKGKTVYFLLKKTGQTTRKIRGDECTQRLHFEETQHSNKNKSVNYFDIRNRECSN